MDKLNEGWDVLNLFDIVRLYEGQNSGEKNKEKIGKTTISEAQLIGRGARYYPFVYKDFEVYERKFDSDTQNELKILETLFYHSQNETRYISELKNALNEIGLMDKDEPKTFKLKLKKEFNSIEFLNKKVYKNERIEKSYQNSKLSELVKGKKNFKFYAKSGKIILDRVEFDKISNESEKSVNLDEIKTLNLVEFCGENVMKNAILYNNYFCMRELKKVLPNLKSMEEFVKSKEFLGQFEIDIVGDSPDLDLLSQKEKLKIVIEFLSNLEKEMKGNTPKFEGSKEFESKAFMEVFSLEKEIITSPSKDSIDMSGEEWFVYEKFHGTIEEESFISLMKNELASYLKAKYTDFYLVRNERDLAIYSFKDGARFEPDFLLFVKGNDVSYQIFIEPKGGYLLKNDEWKQEFLQEIDFSVENDKFRILGLKFYNESIEKDFKDDFKSKI